MVLIADSGATNTEWCLLDTAESFRCGQSAAGNAAVESCLTGAERDSGTVGSIVLERFSTSGINCSTMNEDTVRRHLEEIKPLLQKYSAQISRIYYYSAGIVPGIDFSSHPVGTFLSSMFKDARIEYLSDLHAAARAVCGRRKGIAAILGTGANSCMYDGESITANVHPGGYILGDEGGAASLGRMFLSDYIKGLVPENVAREAGAIFGLSYAGIVSEVYKGRTPAKYLGSFAPFLLNWYGKDTYVSRIVEDNFRSFILRNLSRYGISEYEVGVVGGFGVASEHILRKVGAESGVNFSVFLPGPMDGLISYHSCGCENC